MTEHTDCTHCTAEVAEGTREPEEVGQTIGTCAVCREPVCESHGRQRYSWSLTGIAHDTCWEV